MMSFEWTNLANYRLMGKGSFEEDGDDPSNSVPWINGLEASPGGSVG